MQKFNNTQMSIVLQLRVVSIIALFVAALSIPSIHASEADVKPTLNHQITQQLLYNNTPRVGELGTHWDDFVASINWADYVVEGTVDNASIAYQITQQLLYNNTPRVGELGTHWDDFVASINWVDYVQSNSIYFVSKCAQAC